jgi:hypothetical protein
VGKLQKPAWVTNHRCLDEEYSSPGAAKQTNGLQTCKPTSVVRVQCSFASVGPTSSLSSSEVDATTSLASPGPLSAQAANPRTFSRQPRSAMKIWTVRDGRPLGSAWIAELRAAEDVCRDQRSTGATTGNATR